MKRWARLLLSSAVLGAAALGLVIGWYVHGDAFRTKELHSIAFEAQRICVTDCYLCSPSRALLGVDYIEVFLMGQLNRPAHVRNFGREEAVVVGPDNVAVSYAGEWYRREFCFDFEPMDPTPLDKSSGNLLLVYRFLGAI